MCSRADVTVTKQRRVLTRPDDGSDLSARTNRAYCMTGIDFRSTISVWRAQSLPRRSRTMDPINDSTLALREILRRLQLGERARRIVRDLGVSRNTVAHYRRWAATHGLLTGPLPEPARLAAADGPAGAAAGPGAVPLRQTQRPGGPRLPGPPEANRHLLRWCVETAGRRVHGTTSRSRWRSSTRSSAPPCSRCPSDPGSWPSGSRRRSTPTAWSIACAATSSCCCPSCAGSIVRLAISRRRRGGSAYGGGQCAHLSLPRDSAMIARHRLRRSCAVPRSLSLMGT
jgi:hypothetical protein